MGGNGAWVKKKSRSGRQKVYMGGGEVEKILYLRLRNDKPGENNKKKKKLQNKDLIRPKCWGRVQNQERREILKISP